MMNPEIKKLWVDALRSGEYKQGQERLITYDRNSINKIKINERINLVPNEEQLKDASYCCLGVLCDLYRKHCGENLWENVSFDNTYAFPSRKVINWAELNESNPFVFINDQIGNRALSDVNDLLNFNFNQIADLIDKNL